MIPFVVYVNYPNGTKEYAYLCSDSSVKQGSTVYNAKGVACVVVRTANSDPLAVRHVWSRRQPLCPPPLDTSKERRVALQRQLNQLLQQDIMMKKWTDLARRNPAAKKILIELKEIL